MPRIQLSLSEAFVTDVWDIVFGTEVLISLISALGGWWGCGWVLFLAKGTTSRTLVFLISDKKRNLQINKNGHFEKMGTLGSQFSCQGEEVEVKCVQPSFTLMANRHLLTYNLYSLINSLLAVGLKYEGCDQ